MEATRISWGPSLSFLCVSHVPNRNEEIPMKRHILMLTTCAFILACGAAGASAEESTGDRSHEGYGMMGHGGMMGCGMMSEEA
jgi:hypothetical protein